jgi:hypothetical protein
MCEIHVGTSIHVICMYVRSSSRRVRRTFSLNVRVLHVCRKENLKQDRVITEQVKQVRMSCGEWDEMGARLERSCWKSISCFTQETELSSYKIVGKNSNNTPAPENMNLLGGHLNGLLLHVALGSPFSETIACALRNKQNHKLAPWHKGCLAAILRMISEGKMPGMIRNCCGDDWW